ncbi:DnaD domain-containing protein [Fredinandcohnia onubensis]|uniref:DnaD domain-containing protein n=1 Tax=Fredinandcohnia onubensis TaxID=1571209 RepID=UPI000C0BEEE9|nr:DnaD domain protein [Fredinandcohnia onubensis]
MNGNILLNERPLIVVPTLAKLLGTNESIILQQIHYWLQRSKHIKLGRKWVYLTYDQLVEQIPFISKSTIKRAILKLENKGYLTSQNFNKLKLDKTKWYTINYENLNELKDDGICEDLTFMEEELIPSDQPEQVVGSDGADDVFNLDSPCVQIEQSSGSTWHVEEFNLNTPIPKITTEITTKITSETSSSSKDVQQNHEKEDPFQFFEQNGFGTIGSFIADKIKAWCNELSDELVIKAMKLAVENSSTKRWSYAEAVLRDWVDKGYQTLDDVHAGRLHYKHQTKHPSMKKTTRQELLPDWFHNRDQGKEPVHNPSFEEKKRLFEERLNKPRVDNDIHTLDTKPAPLCYSRILNNNISPV